MQVAGVGRQDAFGNETYHSFEAPVVGKDPTLFKFRKTIALGHTFVLLVIFAPPLIFCTILGQNLDGIFFAGRKLWLVILILPLLSIFFPVWHVLMMPRRSTSLILPSVWLPCMMIGVAASGFHWNVENAEHALFNRDCYAFENKRKLNRAYQVAEEIYDECVLRPGLALEMVSVRDCPLYTENLPKWAPEWRYLESLEQRFHCAGVCRSQPAKRLWDNAGVEAPNCALFAIQWLHAAAIQSRIVIWYTLFIAFAAFPTRQLLLNPLVHYLEKENNVNEDP